MTVGIDWLTRDMMVEDTLIRLQLLDTAGQDNFQTVTHQYFRKADAVVIVYGRKLFEDFTHEIKIGFMNHILI